MERSISISKILSIWNQPDNEIKRDLANTLLSKNFIYDDVHRNNPSQGIEAFLDFIAFFQERVPGVEVQPLGAPEILGEVARFKFIILRSGQVFSAGSYFAMFDQEGKVTRLAGFMDKEPG